MAQKINVLDRHSQTELIDCTTFAIDFARRKFIAIGLDPVNEFNVTIRISTSTRCVCISPDFMRRVYSLMGNILSIITDSPVKNRGERLFLKDETNTLSKLMYRGKNMLVIDDGLGGSRVLLNRTNLLRLQDLKRCVEETITRKLIVTRATVCAQVSQIVTYLTNNIYRASGTSIAETAAIVRNCHSDLIAMHVPCSLQDRSFLEQIKLFAVDQLAQRWIVAKSSSSTANDDDDDDDIGYIIGNSKDNNNNNTHIISDNTWATYPISTERCDELNSDDRKSLADPSLSSLVGAKCEEPPAITPHLTGYSAMTPSPPPPQYSPPSFSSYIPSMGPSFFSGEDQDVNDGPDFFNRYQPISAVMDLDTAVSEMYWIPK